MNKRRLWRGLWAALLCVALLCGSFTAISEDVLTVEGDMAANTADAEIALELDDDIDLVDDIPGLDLDADLTLDDGLIEIEGEAGEIEIPSLSNDGEELPVSEPPTEGGEGEAAGIFTVTFINEDGSTIEQTSWKVGEKPTCGITPTKPADAQYTYTFDGWVDAADTSAKPTVYANDGLPAVTAGATYRAHFTTTQNKFTVTFVSEDGNTELEKTVYDAGATPKYSKAAPTKAADATHYYLFDGWVNSNDTSSSPTVYANDKLPAVTADVTYKAHFHSGTPVPLAVTYSGGTLTKEYDCNAYGAYSKNGQVVYVIPELKTIKSKFKLDLAKGSSWVDGHKSVDFKLTLAKQFSSANVGNDYQFEFRVTLTGDDAAYYTVNQTTITVPAAITPREVVITPRAGLSKVYGTKDPAYPEGSWLSNDTSSPLHQDLSGVPGYGVPVNTKDGKLSLTVTNAAYLLQEAKLKGTKFFPNDGWLTRKEGEDVGKYDITIGKMDFGSNFKTTLKPEVFTITAKNIADDNVTVKAIGNQQYTGKPIKLDSTALVLQYGANTLVEGKDFTTEYTNNTEASTDSRKATVKLTGKGNYTGIREVTFTIINQPGSGGSSSTGYDSLAPKGTSISKLSRGKRMIRVKWKKCKAVTGYQIAFSKTKDFAIWEDRIVHDANKSSLTIKGLKSKQTYYVCIRTYKRLNGRRHYSPWSKSKKVTTK